MGLVITQGSISATSPDGVVSEIVEDGSTDAATAAEDAFDARTADGALPGHFIFVTSQTFNGSLNGTTGADSLCRDIAADAAIPGSYVAFLGDSTHRAIDRLDLDAGPMRLSNGQLIANDVRELLTTGPRRSIDRDELESRADRTGYLRLLPLTRAAYLAGLAALYDHARRLRDGNEIPAAQELHALARRLGSTI